MRFGHFLSLPKWPTPTGTREECPRLGVSVNLHSTARYGVRVDDDRTVVSEATKTVKAARERALTSVSQARKALETARHNYDVVVVDAAEVGLAFTEIARAAGVSEAAIRLYLKRRKSHG